VKQPNKPAFARRDGQRGRRCAGADTGGVSERRAHLVRLRARRAHVASLHARRAVPSLLRLVAGSRRPGSPPCSPCWLVALQAEGHTGRTGAGAWSWPTWDAPLTVHTSHARPRPLCLAHLNFAAGTKHRQSDLWRATVFGPCSSWARVSCYSTHKHIYIYYVRPQADHSHDSLSEGEGHSARSTESTHRGHGGQHGAHAHGHAQQQAHTQAHIQCTAHSTP
jgi:hypothetical protein